MVFLNDKVGSKKLLFLMEKTQKIYLDITFDSVLMCNTNKISKVKNSCVWGVEFITFHILLHTKTVDSL